MKRSTLSITFGGVAAFLVLTACFGTSFFCKPVTPGDTPTIISWNLTFLLPVLALSALFTLGSFGFLVAYMLSKETKTFLRIGFPILLMLTLFIPPILSKKVEADFIGQTKLSADPIGGVVSHRDDVSNLEGEHVMNLPPDTPGTGVVAHFLRDWEGNNKPYRVLQAKSVNIFDPTTKKMQLYQAVAVDSDRGPRRVFLMHYDNGRGVWSVEIYYPN